ncbi:hypothetical protein Vadar_025983 [Vaccinium darrowii]|uniref:Uncharacterized protein n=1 Tax=Vaccinium darrowii TaxID=229202 RepID=A0ACB7YZ79_9ERIC|nr:hypothetical protein Vadar_025983 [Vaccinium darrowii]
MPLPASSCPTWPLVESRRKSPIQPSICLRSFNHSYRITSYCYGSKNIDYNVLVAASKTVGYGDLPDAADAAMLDSDELLRRFYHALLELHLEEGALCSETGRRFRVSKGTPNMLLQEDEVSIRSKSISIQVLHLMESGNNYLQFFLIHVEHEELLLEFSVKQWLVVLQVGEVLQEVEELSSDADAREGLGDEEVA